MEGLTLDVLIGQFGAPGLFIGYLIWRELRNDKANAARTEADKSLAVALNSLAEKIKEMVR